MVRTLLILSKLHAFPAAIEAATDSSQYQVIVKEDLRAAEPLLTRGAIDVVILDSALTEVTGSRLIGQVRAAAPDTPLIVVSAEKHREWEEDAYLQGVSHVITKPIREKLLNHLLDRVLGDAPVRRVEPTGTFPSPGNRAGQQTPAHFDSLEALRDFSGLLSHSLQPRELLRAFLLRLREELGVNRAVVFLRDPSSLPGSPTTEKEDRWLRSACAIGLEQSFLEHFALNLTSGMGAYLRKHGRILRNDGPEAQASREIAREFHLLGGDVAIPILDRETLIGVAVLDRRLTGDAYENEELSLLFRILEEFGQAIRNSWLHDQLRTGHAMLADILSNLGAGCLVIGNNLAVLHCNTAAKRILLPGKADKQQIEFSDIPQDLGSRVFTVMKTNLAVPSFKYQFLTLPGQSFRVAISPFQAHPGAPADAALLTVESVTAVEQAQRVEVEASSMRLAGKFAEHLAHEIGNSVIPLSTLQGLLEGGAMDNEELRAYLSQALGAGVKRITRLANQMMFLARDKTEFDGQIRINELIEEAFRDALVYHSGKAPDFNIAAGVEKLAVAGDHKALRHAFSEVLLNALQATGGEQRKIAVSVSSTGVNGHRGVNVEIRDGGNGSPPEASRREPDTLLSAPNPASGIGLTVTRKIIEDHKGHIEIAERAAKGVGLVRITLPLNG